MIEPKQALHLLRRDSLAASPENKSLTERLLEHDVPEQPMHPGLEFEILAGEAEPPDENTREESSTKRDRAVKDVKLLLSFIALVVAGAGNVVAAKLQAIPMYNYPNFLNLYANFMYIPICFVYIIPTARYGWFNAITPEQLALPKRPFAVMGALDCLAATMQIFASVYLPGPLLVLLPQVAIPLSMILSRSILGERYTCTQILGACIVLLGVLVVLEPVITHRHSPHYYCEAINLDNDCTICKVEVSKQSCLSHRSDYETPWWLLGNHSSVDDDEVNNGGICQWLPFDEASQEKEILMFVWSLVMIASCVPMTLSTIYKQIALGDDTELDPIYLNGWIAIFQFFFSLVVAVPAGMFSSPTVEPIDLPRNVWNGIQCYLGQGTLETGCHPDSLCSFHAALFVNVCLLCNVIYTFVMMFVLKFGSSALLFLALTIMVPIGNLAFALPFMPESTPIHPSDLLALAVIMAGLVLYRFSDATTDLIGDKEDDTNGEVLPSQGNGVSEENHRPWPHDMHTLREPLILTGDV